MMGCDYDERQRSEAEEGGAVIPSDSDKRRDGLHFREQELRGHLIATSGRRGIPPVLLSPQELAATHKEYELVLAVVAPGSIEHQYLRLQRELASQYQEQRQTCRLIVEFLEFHREQMDWRRDHPFLADGLLRPFVLYLVECASQRREALRRAVRHTVKNLDETVLSRAVTLEARQLLKDPDKQLRMELPVSLLRGDIEGVHATLLDISRFVSRYRGPTGREPPLEPHELQFVITPGECDRAIAVRISPYLDWCTDGTA